MCSKEAVIEYLKHFAANAAAGILHGLIGFSIALIIGAFIPVQIPVNTLTDLTKFAGVVGTGAGVLGSVLAVESDGSTFKAGRVVRFVRNTAYPSERDNGGKHAISTRLGLYITSKKAWQDYIFYV